jgi:hypothetical protein
MNAKQTIPVLAKLAPVFAAAGPPVLFGAAIGVVVLWLLSGNEKSGSETDALPEQPDVPSSAVKSAALISTTEPTEPVQQKVTRRRITRDDLASALEYGVRRIPRGEAVQALQSLGFGKTAAYKALSGGARFAGLIEQTEDGLIEWKG